ncbi:MAG: cytochrome c biogenesis protein CcdA [bacterium]|nr:cytochrome c biogenesis protein CcdA [bacterium]
MLALVIINGLIDSFNPCAIGIFLIFLSMLFMLKKEKKHVFQISLVYILAIYVSYLLIGLGMIRVIQFFGVPHLISRIGAGIIILVGVLSIKDYFFPNSIFSTKIPYSARQLILKWTYKATLPAAAVVGVLVGISEFPCSGGIYVTTLGLLSDKTTFVQGFVYLLIYNLMFVMPLILIYAVTTNRRVAMKLMDWQEREKNHMKLAMGIIMTVLGVILIKWFI